MHIDITHTYSATVPMTNFPACDFLSSILTLFRAPLLLALGYPTYIMEVLLMSDSCLPVKRKSAVFNKPDFNSLQI